MAIGKQQIVISADELVAGATTSSNLSNGGFSPESEGINIVANPGVVYASPAAVNIGTLDGRVLASWGDSENDGDRWLVTSNASAYLLNAGSVTNKGNLGTASHFQFGITDCVQFEVDSGTSNPAVYFSATTDIARGTYNSGSGVLTITKTWFSGAFGINLSSYPHPMLIFNKTLFIADGNLLHTWDGTTATKNVLTLKAGETITALYNDPNTGRMLVAVAANVFTATADNTRFFPYQAYIGLYNGTNPTQFDRKIPVDDTITAFSSVGGNTMCIYGDNLGIFNGRGLQFIRKLNNQYGQATTAPIGNIYKNKICNIQNFLFISVTDLKVNPFLSNASSKILCYGEIKPGSPAFFNAVSQKGDYFDFVANYRDVNILYSQFDGVNYNLNYVPLLDRQVNTSSVLATGDSSPLLVTKRYNLPRPATIATVRIFFEDKIAANTTLGTLSVMDDTRTIQTSDTITNPSGGPTIAWFDITPSVYTTEVQLAYQWTETGSNHGVRKIIVFYEFPYE